MKQTKTIIFIRNISSNSESNNTNNTNNTNIKAHQHQYYRYETLLEKLLYNKNKHNVIASPIRIKHEWLTTTNADIELEMNEWVEEIIDKIINDRKYH